MNKGHPAAFWVRSGLSNRVDEVVDEAQSRLEWRRGLSETIIRSLASDYLRGQVDEITQDGYAEYMARGYDVKVRPEKPRKSRRRT